jgi:glycosyltransferase involved in cell wall biosynthesis
MRPKVVYVSYDGADEPLGRSQVVSYLVRLAAEYEITLISFEKERHPPPGLSAELAHAGIRWVRLHYHKRPPVLSTLFDVLTGAWKLARVARTGQPAIVHVRSYVPALIAIAARRVSGGRLLFDIRGFWADERVEGGLWPAAGRLYQTAKYFERRFFAQADAVVTLTRASVPQIEAWSAPRQLPISVIPTCVDLARFGERAPRADGPHVVWVGSIGTWYRFDLAARAASALEMPLTVVTREDQLARELLDGYPATVLTAPPDDVPGYLFTGDVGLCLIESSFSKTASAPTRFAEYLAAGMPVLVTRDIGDLERIVHERGVGVVLEGEDDAAIAEAAQRLRVLAAEPGLPERCRTVARELFDVDVGAARYGELYRRLLAG